MSTCDCGSDKRPGRAACERCAYLDGTYGGETKIIMALRERGGVGDLYQLAADLDMTLRSVQRNIAKLKRAGRVYRTERINNSHDRALWTLIDGLPAYRTTG